jgi:hypothetical protein
MQSMGISNALTTFSNQISPTHMNNNPSNTRESYSAIKPSTDSVENPTEPPSPSGTTEKNHKAAE